MGLQKKIIFNPEESIDFHGFTGPFVQYTYARIKSVLRKAGDAELSMVNGQLPSNAELQTPSDRTIRAGTNYKLLDLERELILTMERYSTVIDDAANELNPSVIANYIFQLAKTFNSFYTEHSISNAESSEKKELRLQLAQLTANVIKTCMALLGIRVPERM